MTVNTISNIPFEEPDVDIEFSCNECHWKGKDKDLGIHFYNRGPGDPPGNCAACPVCGSPDIAYEDDKNVLTDGKWTCYNKAKDRWVEISLQDGEMTIVK